MGAIITQRSVQVKLQAGENSNRKLYAETQHLPAGYIVRVDINGQYPVEQNANCFLEHLRYEFTTTTGNTEAVDRWNALAGGDLWNPTSVN